MANVVAARIDKGLMQILRIRNEVVGKKKIKVLKMLYGPKVSNGIPYITFFPRPLPSSCGLFSKSIYKNRYQSVPNLFGRMLGHKWIYTPAQ